jgi:hypothetical protein
VRDQRITWSHGSGGKAMGDLTDEVFVGSFVVLLGSGMMYWVAA